MELRHLRYFSAVAEELHFGRAAMKLNMSQPPLSQQIQNLEAEIGVRLFDRTSRQVKLTEAGEMFLRRSRSILDAADGAVAEVNRIALGHESSISIGYLSTAMLDQFVPILHRFRQTFPAVDVQLVQLSTSEQLRSVLNDGLDIAFVDLPPQNGTLLIEGDLLSAETAWSETLVAAVSPAHDLAGRSMISLSLLADEDFILPYRLPAMGFYDQIISACQQAGFSPRVTRQTNVLPGTMTLVASGYGVSVVPACVCQPWEGLASFINLKGDLAVGVTVAWNPASRNPAAAHFRASIKEASPKLITAASERVTHLN
jgi:DNA-binding transcriptional LysR family regulator